MNQVERYLLTALLPLSLLAASCRYNDAEPDDGTASASSFSLEGIGFVTGLREAPVTVVEFSDFGCPSCAAFALNSYPTVHGEFVLSGRVQWIYVPFILGAFANSEIATRAAECAGQQDRFWQMHDLLYQRQAEWRSLATPESLLRELASLAGTDSGRFGDCFDRNAVRERIQRHELLADQVGVRATPTFFIDGRLAEGALSPDQFRILLEAALARASRR
jgi:protein-disulfide isomerase